MNREKSAIAIIPARGGSRGVPRKNIRPLAGKPLICHTIEAALQCPDIARVAVSTDDGEIAAVAGAYDGVQVIMRPAELATDSSPTIEATLHALRCLDDEEGFRAGAVVLLQPTSPLRNSRHIAEAMDVFFRDGCDSLLSACPSHAFIWRLKDGKPCPVNYDYKHRKRRQDSEPEYRENGAIYITGYETLLGERNHLGGSVGLYVMPEEASPEIDTEFDFWLCEQLISAKREKGI